MRTGFQNAQKLQAIECSLVRFVLKPLRPPEAPQGWLAIEVDEVVAVLNDMVHYPPGRFCDPLLEHCVGQEIVSDAEDEKVADNFIRTGVALPVVLAVGRPVPLTAV